MLQKGTGERFKYKEAVKEKYPDAKCKKQQSYVTGSITISGFVVTTPHERLSKYMSTAELAWADAFLQCNIK